ncbi:MAG TPA: hypothetical protein VLV86_19280 [Vicinamibacterales bacterium]|nr:hypothetical protein [Vicinamibacterales bacterium]
MADELEDGETPVDDVGGLQLCQQGAYFDAAADGAFTMYAHSAHSAKNTVDEAMSIQSMSPRWTVAP